MGSSTPLIVTAALLALGGPGCDGDKGTDGFLVPDGLIWTPVDAGDASDEEVTDTSETDVMDAVEDADTSAPTLPRVPCDDEGALCDDGYACTEGELCTDGYCTGTPVYDDGLDCTLNCTVVAGDPVEVFIVLGGCAIEGGCWEIGELNPAQLCQVCEPDRDDAAWTPLEDGTLCVDNDPCTIKPECVSGKCTGPTLYDDGDPCTADCAVGLDGSAMPIDGIYPDGTPCEDDDACTIGDGCYGGTCLGFDSPCDDDNDCTSDSCLAGTCIYTPLPDGVACQDDDTCTLSDACAAGACVGEFLDCTSENLCEEGWCTESGCIFTERFEDGNACTTNCALDENGAAIQIFTVLPDGTPCEDGDPCTTSDACTEESCTGALMDCDDGDPLTFDECQEGACTHTLSEG